MRYVKDMLSRLTVKEKIFYQKYGYIIFRRLVPQELLDKCNKRFDEIIGDKNQQKEIIVMYDIKDKKTVNKIQDIHADPVFRSYTEYKNILDLVECFTGPNILAIHSMLIAKPPDIGFETTKHPPHQDLYYFPFRPANHIVAVWTAIETCNTENGCLFVSPGTHVGRLLPHHYPKETVNKFYHGINLPSTFNNWVNLEMEPGDTVFFHPLLIHGSGINKSQRTRRAISCHYMAAECHIVDNDPVQETIRSEVLDLTKKKFPNTLMTYADIWLLKSFLVRGIKSKT